MSKKVSQEDYARAEQLLPWNTAERILNAEVKPQWIRDTEMLWYRRQTREGAEFVRVDAETGECQPAFDHHKLAAALSTETGSRVEASRLPFTDIEFAADDGGVCFAVGGSLYLYDDRDGRLTKLPDAKQIIGERQRLFSMLSRGLVSPDGSRAVSSREANLVLTETASGVEKPLTDDGEPHYAYGKSPDSNTYSLTVRLAGIQLPPMALWSPDSRKLFTTRLDERGVKELHLLQSAPPDGSARPVLHSYRYAMPGDEQLPLAELMVFDVETGSCIRAQCPPLLAPLMSPVEHQRTAWSEDSTQIYFIALQRGDHGCRLCELDAASGEVREILEEQSDTYLELNPATWTRPNPGPQSIRTPKVSFPPDPGASFNYTMPQTLAELGFVVVTLDGMGTPFRSKAFHDVSYGRLDEGGGLEDHIAGLRQLAERHSYMDLERVGITGHSGGGYASTRAILAYPDFYKVAVSSAGNHDQRGYVSYWGEKYLGVPTQEEDGGEGYAAQINARLAGNLKGKLLLIAGDMDDNVHPALTMQLVNALIAANRDFDLLVVPNRNHRTSLLDPYVLRRLWDHFVRHLLGAEPPAGYRIRGPEEPREEADASD